MSPQINRGLRVAMVLRFLGRPVFQNPFPDLINRYGVMTTSRWMTSILTACLSVAAVHVADVQADAPREQAKVMHDRLAGVLPSESVLLAMTDDIRSGDYIAAADRAMEHPGFLNATVKNWVTPWTNEEFDPFQPLNDYSATVLGMIRDDVDFRLVLSGDILYVGHSGLGLPGYSHTNNNHYEQLEASGEPYNSALQRTTQSSIPDGLAVDATAGVITTRAAAKSFFKDGTNRAMFRFTLINHLCRDLEDVQDATLPPDRIRQDVSRSPGGDSRVFLNGCLTCHNGMDPLTQAFAYYNYQYDDGTDPDGLSGRLVYNAVGQTDAETGTRVQAKNLINSANFPYGYITTDDSWDNYWREGRNSYMGWDASLVGSGSGAKSMGRELAHSDAFAQCQSEKVFKVICLRDPANADDRAQVSSNAALLKSNDFKMKAVFAETANYCAVEMTQDL
jgi:hypothetical protein